MKKAKGYRARLIEPLLKDYLSVFGAVELVGPKGCGKATTARLFARSVRDLERNLVGRLASFDGRLVLRGRRPTLIQEWQSVPSLWNAIRHECDKLGSGKGLFILTGSTTLSDKERDDYVLHSGIGRIGTLRMSTMTLLEAGIGKGDFSLAELAKNPDIGCGSYERIDVERWADILVRGLFPENLSSPARTSSLMPLDYVNSLTSREAGKLPNIGRKEETMRRLLRSLARNESTTALFTTIHRDVVDPGEEAELLNVDIRTLESCYEALVRLHVVTEQPAFSPNYRSSTRVGKASKRHLCDPSLAAAALDMGVGKYLDDFKLFGQHFEGLVYHDLKAYADIERCSVRHFRDANSGDEVDFVYEFREGGYLAIEAKLSWRGVEDAKRSLLKFNEGVKVKPKALVVLVGDIDFYSCDKETGIYVLPFSSLRP